MTNRYYRSGDTGSVSPLFPPETAVETALAPLTAWESFYVIVGSSGAVAARAIEPLVVLWCIPGFRRDAWTHAFKVLWA